MGPGEEFLASRLLFYGLPFPLLSIWFRVPPDADHFEEEGKRGVHVHFNWAILMMEPN
jgi:hypothetical protein